MTLANSSTELLTLSDSDFNRVAELIYNRFGIYLSAKKKALVRGRLHKLVKGNGYASFGEYFDKLEEGSAMDLLDLIDRISTNHSFFFREAEHFAYLTDEVLPKIEDEDIRIWSAGSAAGQEAYTIAMVMSVYKDKHPAFRLPSILATDISVTALETAGSGIYPKDTIEAIPPAFRKYFEHVDEENVRVVKELRDLITFKRLNLKQESYPFRGKFHVIFCRNVMIYFDKQTKADLVERFGKYSHNGGYLFIGHSETLGREIAGYNYIKPTVYRRWLNA